MIYALRWLIALMLAVTWWLAPPEPAPALQLRGVVLTPNWSAHESPFVMTPEEQRAEIAGVLRMGGNVVRLHVDWPRLQPDGRIDGEYQAQLDQAVFAAGQYGQAVILNIVTTPCWAARQPSCPLTSTTQFDPPRSDYFAEITSYLLNRYPTLYGYEVWNEPNCCPSGAKFWNGTVAEFAETVNAAVAGRNALGSRTRVIVGGLLPVWSNGDNFLDELYRAGMQGQDGVSIHPYSLTGGRWLNPAKPQSPFNETIQSTHNIMLAHGDGSGLYLTEFGFAPCPARPCIPAPLAERWLATSYREAARYRYVKALTAFSARDYVGGSDPMPGWQMHSGILNRPFGKVRRTLKQLRSRKYLKKLRARRGVA
jgi:hypothetical protein